MSRVMHCEAKSDWDYERVCGFTVGNAKLNCWLMFRYANPITSSGSIHQTWRGCCIINAVLWIRSKLASSSFSTVVQIIDTNLGTSSQEKTGNWQQRQINWWTKIIRRVWIVYGKITKCIHSQLETIQIMIVERRACINGMIYYICINHIFCIIRLYIALIPLQFQNPFTAHEISQVEFKFRKISSLYHYCRTTECLRYSTI